MIDLENERVIPLREVVNQLPSRCSGRRLSPATVWRWVTRKNNPLETIRIGGGRFTSVEAIGRFVEQCSRQRGASTVQTDAGPTPKAIAAGKQLRQLIEKR